MMANKKALPSSTAPVSNGDKCCLSEQINTSTRSIHGQLNRMIIAGLPLALPPYSPDPSMYRFGLLHIAPIYIAFESLWHRILDAPDDLHDEILLKSIRSRDNTCQAKPCNRILSVLSDLRLLDLQRSQRLRADILTLSGNGEQEIDEQLDKVIRKQGTISKFIAHMMKSVNEKPHVLLAYAWVMYMALFSGGRYLSASLQKAGRQFWLGEQDVSSSASVDRGLQFFHFIGEQMGEDIKREFKMRFAAAEALLSDVEKDDIVQEAQQIFAFMLELVDELTQVCASARCNPNQAEKKIGISAVDGRDAFLTGDECPSTGVGAQYVAQNARKAGLPLVRVFSSGVARLVATVSVPVVLPQTLFKPALRPVNAWKFPIGALDLAVAGFILLLNLAFVVRYLGSSESLI